MLAKQITRNFLSLFLSNAVGQLFTLWAFIHIATVFGPEGFGKFSFAQAVALYFLYLADFGLQTLGIRAVAQKRSDLSRYVQEMTTLRAALAVVGFVLLVGFSVVVPKPAEVRVLIIIFGLALLPSALSLEWVFQGVQQMEYVGLWRVLRGVVFAGLVLVFAGGADRLAHAALFYVTGIAVASGVLLGVFVGKFGTVRGQVKLSDLRKILTAAVPLAVGSFITQIDYNFGTLALGFFLSDEVVGLFSAAYKVVLFLWAFAAVSASNAILPMLASSYTRSTVLFSDSLKKLFRLFAMIAIPIGIGGSILASQVIDALYSADYQEAVVVFQLSIWMVVIVVYRVIVENALIASRSRRRYFQGYILAGTLTIVGNLVLVPTLGLVAPPIVGILSEVALLVYFVASCKFIRCSYVFKITVKPMLAGSLMGLALLFLPLNLFVMLAIGIVLYFVLLLSFRCFTIEEVTGYVHSIVR